MNKLLTQCISDAFICTKVAETMNLYSKDTGQTYRHIQLVNWDTGQTYRHIHSLLTGFKRKKSVFIETPEIEYFRRK
jgi:cytidylate kinase